MTFRNERRPFFLINHRAFGDDPDLVDRIQGNIDIYDVSMSIDYEGYATATLNGINSGKLTFEGNLVSEDKTSVFKGMTR